MKIVIAGLMGRGTLEAKVEPLAKIDAVSEILFVRKSAATPVNKTKYIIPPLINVFKPLHLFLAPLTFLFTVIKYKPKLIIGYHVVPYGFFVTLVGILTFTPYIISQTGLKIQEKANKKLLRRILHFVFKNAVQVNCPGENSVFFWQNKYPDIQSNFQVLHSTIDTDYFKPNPIIAKKYDFIFLGRLDKIKRIPLIMEGFKQLLESFDKNFKMVIVGSGPEKENLKKLVTELHLEKHIIFTGFIHDPLTILQQSKFLVMASKSEGLPTAMMQAMACEVIPISNMVGNIGDIVTDSETGFVHDGDALDIYRKLSYSLNFKDGDLDKIKRNARTKIIAKHSHKFAMKKWRNILDKL